MSHQQTEAYLGELHRLEQTLGVPARTEGFEQRFRTARSIRTAADVPIARAHTEAMYLALAKANASRAMQWHVNPLHQVTADTRKAAREALIGADKMTTKLASYLRDSAQPHVMAQHQHDVAQGIGFKGLAAQHAPVLHT